MDVEYCQALTCDSIIDEYNREPNHELNHEPFFTQAHNGDFSPFPPF